MNPAHSGILTISDGTRTLHIAHDDLVVTPTPREPGEVKERPESLTWTVTLQARYATPPIGALRAWARRASPTPWHRRSIASWRSAWRKVHGLTTITVEDAERVKRSGPVIPTGIAGLLRSLT